MDRQQGPKLRMQCCQNAGYCILAVLAGYVNWYAARLAYRNQIWRAPEHLRSGQGTLLGALLSGLPNHPQQFVRLLVP